MIKRTRPIIAVIGAGECTERVYQLAETAGKRLAEAGYDIVCGGLGGVMEAVCKGAQNAGAKTIGILPGDDILMANAYVDIPVATGMGIGRNIIIIRTAQAVLAIDGSFGTLSEIAYALQMQKPVIGIDTWEVSDKIIQVANIDQAINELAKQVE